MLRCTQHYYDQWQKILLPLLLDDEEEDKESEEKIRACYAIQKII